ncbi:MAG: hypothetical protein UT44_C0015G0013 [Candidatus Levybacteria bacterium GW2011_GWA1_39_32]|nr:MAG: hypothetical protein UT44_C0015G0013 [Candidatus Levybacteria bacterium GW2011_GWA1_39_32]
MLNKIILLFLISLFVSTFHISKVSADYKETEMDKKKLFKVVKVIDGDTISARIRGKNETIRLLGIDTPESVDPRKPVQCFAKEATNKMKSFVLSKFVKLVDDPTQGNRDKYSRLLRHVYLSDSKETFVNGEMVKQGYAFSFREYPTKMLEKFNAFEKYARENSLGLWGSCPNSKPPVAPRQTNHAPFKPPNSGYLGGDKDCGDFATHAEAQSFFISQGGPGSDPHRLDADHDGFACETLP